MTVSVNDKYYNLIIEGVYAKDEDEAMDMYSMFMASDATNLYIPLKTAQAEKSAILRIPSLKLRGSLTTACRKIFVSAYRRCLRRKNFSS